MLRITKRQRDIMEAITFSQYILLNEYMTEVDKEKGRANLRAWLEQASEEGVGYRLQNIALRIGQNKELLTSYIDTLYRKEGIEILR